MTKFLYKEVWVENDRLALGVHVVVVHNAAQSFSERKGIK